MKLDEVAIAKKLDALCKKLKAAVAAEGYKEPDFTIRCRHDGLTDIELGVDFNIFYHEDQESFFTSAVNELKSIMQRVVDPTRIIDDSYFGGSATSIIKRGKMINGAALLSDVKLTAKLPVNRFSK